MADDIRQEAVERASAKLHAADPTIIWDGLAAAAIDASGLIEQGEALSLSAIAWEQEAKYLREQLAAERALCDRLARQYQTHVAYSCWWQADADVLADYRAFRATEHANTEKGGDT